MLARLGSTLHQSKCLMAMASGGRKISSFSVTYEEEHLDTSWSNRAGEQQCRALEYQDTATVPEMSADDLSGHLQSETEELYVDTDQKMKNITQYGYHDNKLSEPDDTCLHEHSDRFSDCGDNTVGAGQGPYPVQRNDHALYVLEDRLRHKVNVSIEDFRAHIQEVFYEQFDLYRHPEAPDPTRSTNSTDVERSCDSVCTSHSSIDSGVSGVDSEEQSVNLCLIKLQTCAAVITSRLQRAEYVVT